MSKGSRQRPMSIPMSDFDKQWDQIFGKKKKVEEAKTEVKKVKSKKKETK